MAGRPLNTGSRSQLFFRRMRRRREFQLARPARPEDHGERLVPSCPLSLPGPSLAKGLKSRPKGADRPVPSHDPMGTVEGGGYEMENIEFRFNRIVVAIDGSAGAYRALQWAITLARRTGAEIVAVHVGQ